MKRNLFTQLQSWKNNPARKPLVLMGARQVGKTYILKAFGKFSYQNIAYVNFENTPGLSDLFEQSLKPQEILKILSIELNMEILPEKTLIIFDEVQECPHALNSLKYFREQANQYHICASGSLLGVTLAHTKGFPVGQVDFLHLYPLSFMEFLRALDEEQLLQYLFEIKEVKPLPKVLHEKLLKFFKEYLYIGGMPATIDTYRTSHDFQQVRTIQLGILNSYRLDFAKHAPSNAIIKINQTWDVIPGQLAKENKKFIYSVIRKGARAQEYEIAIQWLKEAGLVHKIYNVSVPKLPLIAYANHEIFKLYLCDVGLLGAMSELSAKTIIHDQGIFQEFKGSITENYVAQELARQGYNLYYWTSSGQAELDFLLQREEKIYPIEVKSGQSLKKKSLTTYIQKYNPQCALRFSTMNLMQQENLINFPLYLIELLGNFL
jgi:predicted AAA+ superfamily ATPase